MDFFYVDIQKQLLKSQSLLAKYQELLLKQQAVKRSKNTDTDKKEEEIVVPNKKDGRPPPHQPPSTLPTTQSAPINPTSLRPFTDRLDTLLKEEKTNADVQKRSSKFPRPPLMSSTKFSDITSAGSTPSRKNVDAVTTEENFIKHLEDSGSKLREQEEIINFSDLNRSENQKRSKLRKSPIRVNRKEKITSLDDKISENDGKSLSFDKKVKEKADSSSSVRFNLESGEPSVDENRVEMERKQREFLQEERRLKSVLAEQEKLLEDKKKQLKNQQMIQKARLKYFEKTGSFPARCSLTDNLNEVIDALNEDKVYDQNSDDEEKNYKFLKDRGIEIKKKPDRKKILTR